MTVQRIPTSSDPYYVQRTDLEGREYVLQFDWSTREEVWYLSISDSSGEVLSSGIKLICNWPLTYRKFNPAMPPGNFMISTKTEGDDSPPGLLDMGEGGRCELTYVTSNHVFTDTEE